MHVRKSKENTERKDRYDRERERKDVKVEKQGRISNTRQG